jgi:hypothetical protein
LQRQINMVSFALAYLSHVAGLLVVARE